MIGILLLPMACSIWIMALVQMKRHGGIPAGRQYYDTTFLIDQGLFSVVRHPQYLSYILLTAGFILISQHISVVIPGVIAILCFYMQTLQEEKLLRKKFTDDYEKYCRRVHRFNLVAGTVRYFKNHP